MSIDLSYISDLIGLISVTLSIATIPIVFINYLNLFNNEVRLILSREIKKFFLTLLATIIIISCKIIFGCTLLPGIISTPPIFREFMTTALSLLLLAYNVELAYIFIKNNFIKPIIDHVPPLIIYPMTTFLFFQYIVNYTEDYYIIINNILNVSSFFFLLTLVWVVYRLKKYLKIEKMIVEPIDILKPTILFVLATYISSLTILISLHDILVAKAFFMISLIKFTLSLIYLDKSISWIFSFKK